MRLLADVAFTLAALLIMLAFVYFAIDSLLLSSWPV